MRAAVVGWVCVAPGDAEQVPLVRAHERLDVAYREVERGAEIRYRSDDASVVAAIHPWFDAQLSDHGEHATPHH